MTDADNIRRWREHPASMVRELFEVEPDPWQHDILEVFPHKPRIAMQACKGPGKSAVLAWIGWNFMLTRPQPKCAATSVSGANLQDNLWAELAKWREKSPLLKKGFEWTQKRIFAREFPETWFMSARTWPQNADPGSQAGTLAGLHADYILFLLDETGGYPDAVMATAEAALSSCIEGHIVQAGNPTHLAGPLYRAATRDRNMWYVIEITGDPDDPKRSSRIRVEWARAQIQMFGASNPWVLVNVFGRFPPSSINTLIGPDEVTDAMKRAYRPHEIGNAPRILGVDVARFGDDASSIAKRQGIQVMPFSKYRGLDSIQGAGRVARMWTDWNADAVFIDDTGGFGSGWVDQLQQLGRAPIPIGFAKKAHDDARYFNKRTEMYFDAVNWIRQGGALPESPELVAGLTQTTYSFKGSQLLLEPKELIKVKLGYSPDDADAFVLTFAEPVLPKQMLRRAQPRIQSEYDAFAIKEAVEQSFDPYRE